MANAPPINTGTITVTNGSATVTGTGTPFQAADVANGLLVTGGEVNLVLGVQSETELTLYVPWTGPTLTDVPYAIWRTYSQTAKMVQIHDRLNALIGRIEAEYGALPAFMTGTFLTATTAAEARSVLGLNNVDNTSDADKPVSTAVQNALASKAVPAMFGAGAPVNVDYVSARGADLFTNGTGLLGNNYNMPAEYAFDPVVTPALPGAFRFDGHGGPTLYSTEFMPVDPGGVYRLSSYIRQQGLAGDWSAHPHGERHHHYAGVACYDIDGNTIGPEDHMRWHHGGTDSLTTLAAPLTPGDMTITVADATGWNETDGSIHNRGVILFGYKNALGYKYDFYSRLWRRELFDPGGVDKATGVITLNQPLPAALGNPDDPGGTWPAGTAIANQSAGGLKYSLFSALIVPAVDRWYRTTNFVGGIDTSGRNVANNFPPGTAFVKLLWLPSYTNRAGGLGGFPDTGAGHSVWFAGLSVTPEPQGVIVANADGSKTLKVPRANLATGAMDVVTASLVTEAV